MNFLEGCLESEKHGRQGAGDIHTWANFCSCYTLGMFVPVRYKLGCHIRFCLKKGINSLKIIVNWSTKPSQVCSLCLLGWLETLKYARDWDNDSLLAIEKWTVVPLLIARCKCPPARTKMGKVWVPVKLGA
jgi:hypothetical protein